jgi:hypothetical protein
MSLAKAGVQQPFEDRHQRVDVEGNRQAKQQPDQRANDARIAPWTTKSP